MIDVSVLHQGRGALGGVQFEITGRTAREYDPDALAAFIEHALRAADHLAAHFPSDREDRNR